jgi:hypothetical protein
MLAIVIVIVIVIAMMRFVVDNKNCSSISSCRQHATSYLDAGDGHNRGRSGVAGGQGLPEGAAELELVVGWDEDGMRVGGQDLEPNNNTCTLKYAFGRNIPLHISI